MERPALVSSCLCTSLLLHPLLPKMARNTKNSNRTLPRAASIAPDTATATRESSQAVSNVPTPLGDPFPSIDGQGSARGLSPVAEIPEVPSSPHQLEPTSLEEFLNLDYSDVGN